MRNQRLPAILTIINFVLLAVLLSQFRPARAQGSPPIVRARALEIVDDRGRVRASITLEASGTADESVLLKLTSDPTGGPSVHLQTSRGGSGLRLIMGNPRGAPGVKLDATTDSAGLRVGDGLDTGIDVTAKPSGNLIRVTNRDGRQQIVQP
jgi:hypothetical protein